MACLARLWNYQIITSILTLVAVYKCNATVDGGMLQVIETESRQVQELNGMWNFRADMSVDRNTGMKEKWFQQPLYKSGPVMDMPVPSSYNDITADESLRDFTGWVWYEREAFVSSDWSNKRVVVRVDSAHYYSSVYVNGALVVEHNGGHLPFEADVSDHVTFGSANRITIAVNNTLTHHTLPPGTVTVPKDKQHYPEGYLHQNLQFDFFNYAGIHRRVRLYATPKTYIDDITIRTSYQGSTGIVQYDIQPLGPALSSPAASLAVTVDVVQHNGSILATSSTMSGNITIPDVLLWWPYTMSAKHYGYQYTLRVRLTSATDTVTTEDVYRLQFGVRTVNVTDTQLLINDQPFYCHGVDKHEDADLRGKGLDFSLIARDFHMMKWLGVNCFRTSHYPYAEEIMDQADKQGIVVIDECPAVGLKVKENYSNTSLAHHIQTIEELIRRDKNRPAVIMWSVANEPGLGIKGANTYLEKVINYTKSISHDRLVTYVSTGSAKANSPCHYVDVVCNNKYYGWYEFQGETYMIGYMLPQWLTAFYKRFNKPVIMSEFGAETIPGMHMTPAVAFTEDYQVEVLHQHHLVFDELKKDFMVGELIWNYADFQTDQTTARVMGNHKGILTRQRQPKASAHLVRNRYWTMINASLPLTGDSNDTALSGAGSNGVYEDYEQLGPMYYYSPSSHHTAAGEAYASHRSQYATPAVPLLFQQLNHVDQQVFHFRQP